MPPSEQDFRRDKRVAFTTRAPLAICSGSRDVVDDATTIDLSESGVRIRFGGQLMPGQIVDLYLTKRPEPCRVVWTSLAGAQKELIAGLEFIYPLPDPRKRQTPPSSGFEPIN
jgi:hypothetical protein